MFTMETTEGFTQVEIDTLNDALSIIMLANDPSSDNETRAWFEEYVSDLLNNAWTGNQTAVDLVTAAGY